MGIPPSTLLKGRSVDDPLPTGKLSSVLLHRMLKMVETTDDSVLVGPGLGRDAAAIVVGDTILVVKTDPITFATYDSAAYLVDINANDLACLGAKPRWLLVTALLPEGQTTETSVEIMFRSLASASQRRGITLVGGHTEVTHGLDRPMLTGMLLGTVPMNHLVRPGGARAGDRLFLTKALAIEGTALLARDLSEQLISDRRLDGELLRRAARFLETPGISVLADAAAAVSAECVTALHDPTEGGLATGIRELAMAADCGAWLDVDAVPVLPETYQIAAALNLDPLGMLASGSLLIAAKPESATTVLQAMTFAGIATVEIGKIVPPTGGFTMRRNGHEVPLPDFSTDEVARVLSMAETSRSRSVPDSSLLPFSEQEEK